MYSPNGVSRLSRPYRKITKKELLPQKRVGSGVLQKYAFNIPQMGRAKKSQTSSKITPEQVESIKKELLGPGANPNPPKRPRPPTLAELAKTGGKGPGAAAGRMLTSSLGKSAFQKLLGKREEPKIVVAPVVVESSASPTCRVQLEKTQFDRSHQSLSKFAGMQMQKSFRFPKKNLLGEDKSPTDGAGTRDPLQQRSKVQKLKEALASSRGQRASASKTEAAASGGSPDPLQKTIKRFLQIESKLTPTTKTAPSHPVTILEEVAEESGNESCGNTTSGSSSRNPFVESLEPRTARPQFGRGDDSRLRRGSVEIGKLMTKKLQLRPRVDITPSLPTVWTGCNSV